MSDGARFQLSESDLAEAGTTESERCSLPPIIAAHQPFAAAATNAETSAASAQQTKRKSPVVVLVVGMAGSGKTTLMAQLYRSLSIPSAGAPKHPGSEVAAKEGHADNEDECSKKAKTGDTDDPPGNATSEGDEQQQDRKKVGYFINIDPATKNVPFGASIDIRDTVDYKEVMKQHNLGPNGAIMTSLNLFATKFDQVIHILEKRAFGETAEGKDGDGGSGSSAGLDYIIVDTPGQIEAFTWSASGTIMSEALASSFPTVLAFVVDTPRCAASPNTFMSNMLYACSMLYRTRLPLVVVFNKTDVVPHTFATEWMTDYESFQEALDEHAADSGYYGSLTRSLSLVLDEFYSTLHHVGVSAATGDGMDEFWSKVDVAAKEFVDEYLPDLRSRIEEQEAKRRAMARDSVRRLERDMADASIRGGEEQK